LKVALKRTLPITPVKSGIVPIVSTVLSATPVLVVAPKKSGWNAAVLSAMTQTPPRLSKLLRFLTLPPNSGRSRSSMKPPIPTRATPRLVVDASEGARATAVPAVPSRVPDTRTVMTEPVLLRRWRSLVTSADYLEISSGEHPSLCVLVALHLLNIHAFWRGWDSDFVSVYRS
jgi:hypothetical protein